MAEDILKCPECNNDGTRYGCPKCGTIKYSDEMVETVSNMDDVVPLYFRDKHWDILKASKHDDEEQVKIVLKLLNELVMLSLSGSLPKSSYMILVPTNHGKQHAMYSMIKNYIKAGLRVSKVYDIMTLNILMSSTTKECRDIMLDLMLADIAFVYETDFNTRKLTADLFFNIASSRALRSKPTIFMGSVPFKELSTWSKEERSIQDNMKERNSMSEPIVLDGVARRV